MKTSNPKKPYWQTCWALKCTGRWSGLAFRALLIWTHRQSYFFSLEKNNGECRLIHALRSTSGQMLTEAFNSFCSGLPKVLANRLKKVMDQVIQRTQTYCVPGRSIVDNVSLIRDFLEVSGSLCFDAGLVSLDQEKAFDRVQHRYL